MNQREEYIKEQQRLRPDIIEIIKVIKIIASFDAYDRPVSIIIEKVCERYGLDYNYFN
jgi:hypothetical protein